MPKGLLADPMNSRKILEQGYTVISHNWLSPFLNNHASSKIGNRPTKVDTVITITNALVELNMFEAMPQNAVRMTATLPANNRRKLGNIFLCLR